MFAVFLNKSHRIGINWVFFIRYDFSVVICLLCSKLSRYSPKTVRLCLLSTTLHGLISSWKKDSLWVRWAPIFIAPKHLWRRQRKQKCISQWGQTMLGQPIPLCVSRALQPGQALKYGQPLTELCGSLIFVSLRRAARSAQFGSMQDLVVEEARGHSLWHAKQNWNTHRFDLEQDLQTAHWPSRMPISDCWQMGHWETGEKIV